MVSKNLVYLVDDAPGIKPKALAELIRRVSQSRFRQPFPKPIKVKLNDPYLLILLADQELVDGREQQAKYLVEAAYEAFDRNSETGLHRLHLAN